MKRNFLTGLALLVLLNAFAYAQQVEFLNPEILDFGKVPQGEVINGTIRFVNKSATPITVEDVRPSCGCTAVKPEKMVYASGETANIPFTIKTDKFSGMITKTIRVIFKDIEPKTHVVTARATVVTEVNVTPRFLNFQNIVLNPDTLVTDFFEIENTTDHPVTIDKISSPSELITIVPNAATIAPGKSHLIRVEVKPSTVGRHNTSILIETSNKKIVKKKLPVFFNVREMHLSGSK